MQKLAIASTALTLCVHVTTSNAQSRDGDGVIVDVEACIDLQTREQQLACYEDQVNEVLRVRDAEPDEGDTETATTDNAPEPELSRRAARAERREARATEKRQREADEAAARAAEAAARAAQAAEAAAAVAAGDTDSFPGEIVSTVVALEEILPNRYRITLDNGQIWQQDGSKRYLLLVGAEVRLRPSRWGPSYRLTDPNVGNFIQVSRLN